MKVSYYVLAGQIGDRNLYKAEALAHFLNKNLPNYHFEIVRVPPPQWHSFVEYLVMKLWHPKQYLYYHRFSTKIQNIISKIVDANDSMTRDVKYKPWEEVCEIKTLSKSSLNNSINNDSIGQNQNNKLSNGSLNNNNNTKNNDSIIQDQNDDQSNTYLNEGNGTNSFPKEEDKNKVLNISLNALKQTIVITSSEELNNNSSGVEMKSNSYTNNSSIELSNDQASVNDDKTSSGGVNNIDTNGSHHSLNKATSNNNEEEPMIESYYKLPIDIDTYVQELLEELPQFTWKVNGEFIGDCNSFFDYIKKNYGYQINIDDVLLDDIVDEDIKIQKYRASSIPVVFNTKGIPYFSRIPHLSETTSNVSIDYSKKNNTHLTIKTFRRNLSNMLDDIEYNDYVNKAGQMDDIHPESRGYSELEIDSEDMDENITNEDNNYSDSDSKSENNDEIRMPVHRYHRYLDSEKKEENTEKNSGKRETPSNENEKLVTSMNSKCSPSSTELQTNINNLSIEKVSESSDHPGEQTTNNKIPNEENNLNEQNLKEEINDKEINNQLDNLDINEQLNNKEIQKQKSYHDDINEKMNMENEVIKIKEEITEEITEEISTENNN